MKTPKSLLYFFLLLLLFSVSFGTVTRHNEYLKKNMNDVIFLFFIVLLCMAEFSFSITYYCQLLFNDFI